MFKKIRFIRKAFILGCLFSLSSSNLIAQEEGSQERKWAISLNISPDVAFRHLSSDVTSNDNIIDFRNGYESPMICYTGLVGIEYHPLPRLAIRSGINYSVRGEVIDFEIWIPPTTEFDNSLPTTKVRNEYHSFGIPLLVSYDIIHKTNINLFITGGVGLNYLYKRYSRVQSDQLDSPFQLENSSSIPANDDFTDFNLFNPSAILSLGVDFKLGGRSALRIEPIFRHSLLPLANAPIKEYQFSGGLNIGYLFSL